MFATHRLDPVCSGFCFQVCQRFAEPVIALDIPLVRGGGLRVRVDLHMLRCLLSSR
jgi:hypothetical protein